jgi:hypothetical protein
MPNKRTELSGNGRPEIDPETGLAYEWVAGTKRAVEDAIIREAKASGEACHAVFASCLYKNFLDSMRRSHDASVRMTET